MEVSKPVLLASAIAAGAIVVAAVAVGFALGSGRESSPTAGPSSTVPAEPSPSPTALPPCLAGVDKTSEGRQAIKFALEAGDPLPTAEDCDLIDEALIALKRVPVLDPGYRAELNTPLGMYSVWGDMIIRCQVWDAKGIGPKEDLDDLARFYRKEDTTSPGAMSEDSALASVAVESYYAAHSLCPNYASDMTSWVREQGLPWNISMDTYKFK